jgi:transglutaminase/protease-like cytokinesis protein 3
MTLSAPQLPSRFPCWCRAVYSWGGETKTDLGFVEGDLIECLNAGDGQWWMGRLRRDRRMMGLFPSNFVEVLGQDFVPKSRETGPMVQAGPSPTANPTSAPKKEKTVFRKPFQAHKQALAPSSELARSGTAIPDKSSIPQTPPRDGSSSKGGKSLRTPATAVKQRSSLSRPLSQSSPPSRPRGSSPAHSPSPLQETEVSRPSRLNRPQSRPHSPAVSPSALQATDLPPSRPTMQFSKPQSPAVPPHTVPEPDLPPPVPVRQQSRYQQPPVFPHMSYETEIPPVPTRQLSQYESPTAPSHPFQEPDVPPPVPTRRLSRLESPADSHSSHDTEVLSPMPTKQLSRPSSREFSPLELQDREESPPPPPPPHRVAVNRQPSSQMHAPAPLDMNDRYMAISRTPSPAAPSDANGNTPSPLRDAMEDVMSSLEDMGMPKGSQSGDHSHSPAQSRSPSPAFNNPWSPDAYDGLREPRIPQSARRPLTSIGFDGDHGYDHSGSQPHRNSVYTNDSYVNGPPQLNNYVQRMESRLRQLQEQNRRPSEDISFQEDEGLPPPPPKHLTYHGRHNSTPGHYPQLRNQRSGHDLGDVPNRTWTNKSNTTNSSSGVQSNGTNMTASTDRTSQSLMSGASAGGFSATSAGSFARRDTIKNGRPNTAMDTLDSGGFSDVSRPSRPETPLTGVSYHSSHNTSHQGASPALPWSNPDDGESGGVFGGLSTPKAKKHGFFKKIFESAKTGAANARSSIAVSQNGGSYSPTKGRPVSPIRSQYASKEANRESGSSGSAMDWVQVRRDVNRASSPSRNERVERAERCQMMDHAVIYAVEELQDTAEGDESIDGLPISEPTNFTTFNLNLVDKSARFVNSLPPMTNPISLAQGYVCRPYKSDVQRLRAIFTWVSEKIAWDDPVDEIDIDMRRILQSRRASPQEVACLVNEMCAAVGLHSEAIQGFLKTPGELAEVDSVFRPNHWWNTVLVDGEWRVMDCSLASPTNPRRSQFVSSNSTAAEGWYFLVRPLEICYTHIPLFAEEQHICPPVSPDVLLALPAACPSYFKHNIQFPDYDTSLFRIDGLEVMQIRLLVPPEVECAAEAEAPAFACDADGDFFESGDIVRKRALVQPDWVHGLKRFTIKAVLPGDEGQGTVKVYAGRKGLMHNSRDIPHPLALALPIIHTGENPSYDFVLRHPTGHAQRNDLYIMQPQCARLAMNHTFVFAVRQHPSSPPLSNGIESGISGRASPTSITRPASSLSMVSSSAGGSSVSGVSNEFSASTSAITPTRSGSSREKPAKLAIQAPSGKIHRLNRKADHMMGTSTSDSVSEAAADGSVWETVIKIGEHGTWRGLVLADRVARWCVFCEWHCY